MEVRVAIDSKHLCHCTVEKQKKVGKNSEYLMSVLITVNKNKIKIFIYFSFKVESKIYLL